MKPTQTKTAVFAQSTRRPVAPPAFRPQATPKVMQPKMANSVANRKPPVAPPVYRPGAKQLVQQKAGSQVHVGKAATPVRVVQLSPRKFDRSKNFLRERKEYDSTSQTTFKKTASQFYGEKVSQWLTEMTREPGVVGKEARAVLMRIQRDRIGPNDWKKLGWYIDWVNRAVDAHSNSANTSKTKKDDKTHLLGVPMSKQEKIGLKYANSDEYVARKMRRQGQIRHISARGVESMIVGATGGASEVGAKLFINGQPQVITRVKPKPKEKLPHEDTFSIPYGTHNHEIDKSSGDGEVVVLAKALELLVNDLKTQGAHQHKLALVGPYGACDGCKDRIRSFKQQWNKAKTEANTAGSLLITYFYRNEAAPGPDRKDSQYGWHQSRQGSIGGVDYYYWSTVS